MNALRILLFFIFFASHINAIDIGSDSGVARFLTKQILDDGDRIAGFAAIEGGFGLRGSRVTGTFDSLFPVEGEVSLDAGTLILNKNLCFGKKSWVGILGNITGNENVLELSSSITAIPSLSDEEIDCSIFLVTEQVTPDIVETVDWTWDSKYIALGSDIVATNSGICIYEFDGSALTLIATSTIAETVSTINEVRWHPFQYVLAVVRDNSTNGDEVFTFSFVPATGELIQLSSDEIDGNVTAAAWHPTANYLAIGGHKNSRELVIYPVDSEGILDTASRYEFNVNPNRNVQFESIGWDNKGDYLGVGYNSNGSDAELEVYAFSDSPSLSLTLNASKVVGNKIRGLDWNPTFSWIFAVGVDGTSNDNVEIYEHDNVTGSLIKLTGKALGTQAEGIDWHPDGGCLGVGRDKLSGEGKLFVYMFDKDAPSLTQVTEIVFSKQVEALRWAPNGLYVATGDDNDNLAVSERIKGKCFTVSDLNIIMNSDLTIKHSCLTFSGTCMINGRGNVLTLESPATLVLAPNSKFIFRDVEIKGYDCDRFHLSDATSALTFENVHLYLDVDYTFTNGSFNILGQVLVSGDGQIFAYQSDQVSTILSKSQLLLDEGLTFSYDAPAPNLLQFEDKTSKLMLDGATLHATTTGLELTKGKVKIGENSVFSSEIIVLDQEIIDNGITFGDQNKQNDCKLILLPEVNLTCVQGSIRYKNVKSNSLRMDNQRSNIHMNSNTTIWLYENIDMRPGQLIFDNQSRIMRAPGKNVTGSIIPLGTLIRGSFTP